MLTLYIADVEKDVDMKNLSRKEALRKGEKMDDLISRQTARRELFGNSEQFPSAQPERKAISKWKKEFIEYVDSLDITRDDWKGIIEYIDELPSAEPDTTTRDSIPAKTGKNDGDGTSGDCISRRQAIDALKICDANYDGTNCGKCPLRDDRWNGAWWDDETDCHTKLMRDTAKLLETLSAQPEIIRCKDCKHSRFFDPCFYCYEMGGEIIVPENGFCFMAERRTDETD